MRLLRDRRTADAYRSAQARNLADPQLGIPDPFGAPVNVLLKKLKRSETVLWLSWAYEVREGLARWWVLTLTSERLLGVSPTLPPELWAVPANLWHATTRDGDVILIIPGGAPLRVRGAAPSAELFGAPAPQGDDRVTAGPTSQGVRAVDTPRPGMKAPVRRPEGPGSSGSAEREDPIGHLQPPEVAVETEPDKSPGVVVSTWQEAEALAAWHMKKLGFSDAAMTGAGADRGIDVVSDDAAAQVKHYAKSPIGAPAVQQLRGAATGRDWALFYSWSGYTKSATEFAEAAHVALFEYDEGGAVRPVNDAAQHLVKLAGMETVPSISGFELEREAKQKAQRYFDLCFARFSAVMRQTLVEAETNPQVHLAGKVELARVQAIVADVGSRTVPLSEFLELVERINDATRRLAADIGIDPEA